MLSSSSLNGDDSFDVFGLSVLLVSRNLISLFEESDTGTGAFESDSVTGAFESDSGTGTQGLDSGTGAQGLDSGAGAQGLDSGTGAQGLDSAMGDLVVDSDVSIFSSVPSSDGCTTAGSGVGTGGSEGVLMG